MYFEVKDIELGPIFLEVYRWNRWIKLEPIRKGKPTQYAYPLKTISHSGENSFRVMYPTSVCIMGVTEIVNYQHEHSEVQFSSDLNTRIVTFSEPTNYEVYTAKGNAVTSGFGTSIDMSRFSLEECDDNDQLFYLNLDNRNEKLKIRHPH